MPPWRTARRWAPLAAALLAGCAALPADRGRDGVAALVQERGRQPPASVDAGAATALVKSLIREPLAVDAAVRVALLNSPRLKAAYARLGFAAADVYEAGRLSNPRLSGSILFSDEPGALDQIGFGLAQSFTSLLLLPARSRLAEGAFEEAQARVAAEVLEVAADVEAAHYALAAAAQVAAMREAIARAAGLSADLAQRFFDAGNINRRQLATEQAAATQARLDADAAQAEVLHARIALGRLLGLPASGAAWSIAAGLPAPLAKEDLLEDLLARADRARVDLLAARKAVALHADALGVTRRFRYLGDIELGYETERETDGSRKHGPALSLELPLFNQNADEVARAEAALAQAEAALAELEIGIASGVHGAHAQVLAARARAERYRTSLIPQREEMVARAQEEVNYMLAGQFDLLLMKQQEYDAYQGYLETVRDYWLARVELTRHVGAPLPSSAQPTSLIEIDRLTQPQAPAQHQHHEGMNMDHEQHAPPPEPEAPAGHPHHHGDAP